jgi:hypothetical protein
VHDDEIVLGHDAIDGCRRVAQIAVESGQRLSQAFPALRPCRVLNEVPGDQVERGAVATVEGPVEGRHGFRGRHGAITQVSGPRVQG